MLQTNDGPLIACDLLYPFMQVNGRDYVKRSENQHKVSTNFYIIFKFRENVESSKR